MHDVVCDVQGPWAIHGVRVSATRMTGPYKKTLHAIWAHFLYNLHAFGKQCATSQASWMAVPAFEYTPVKSRRGVKVHTTSLRSPTRTACGRNCNGWIVAARPSRVTCTECKLAITAPEERCKAPA